MDTKLGENFLFLPPVLARGNVLGLVCLSVRALAAELLDLRT